MFASARFTDRARKVIGLAKQEAQRFKHEYVGTEHILLGLVREGSGVGANVLKNLDVDLDKVRTEVEKLVPNGPGKAVSDKLPRTPRAEKVIEYAIEEARKLKHEYVGTEHLLLGLLREQEGVAAQVLTNLGVELDEARQEVLHLLDALAEEKPSQTGSTGSSQGEGSPVRYLRLSTKDLPAEALELIERVAGEFRRLEHAKQEAVNDGRFEQAAQLRDRLAAMRKDLEETLARWQQGAC